MKVKQFTGKDYKEAIQKAKAEMGSDAIIFQSREIRPKGWRWFFSPKIVEVTVVIDEDIRVDIDRMRQTAALKEEPIIYNRNTIFNNKKVVADVNLLPDEDSEDEDNEKAAVDMKTKADEEIETDI
ncbi:MAG: hypothetical protein LBK69_07625 [Syntrophomonadaceae bacterium]|jgi:flagellar biosynthesis GTPase FlhF|nr:hypothetical protein [Syntrophomonadaceae bacterium]